MSTADRYRRFGALEARGESLCYERWAGGVAALAGQAPENATLVVFHSSVLFYVDAAGRSAFTTTVRDLPGYWISNEEAFAASRDTRAGRHVSCRHKRRRVRCSRPGGGTTPGSA